MPVIVLIRPGATEFDEQLRIQGTLDLPLSPRGVGQVERLADLLTRYQIERLYCSPGEPARTTAEMIGERLGVVPQTADELRNRDEGLWQGLLRDELKRKQPRLYRQWVETPYAVCPPEGELLEAVVERCAPFVNKLVSKRGPIAIVAPEPVATVISCQLRRVDPAADAAWQPLEPGQAEVIEVLQSGAMGQPWGERVMLLGEEPVAIAADHTGQEGRGER